MDRVGSLAQMDVSLYPRNRCWSKKLEGTYRHTRRKLGEDPPDEWGESLMHTEQQFPFRRDPKAIRAYIGESLQDRAGNRIGKGQLEGG